MSQFDTIILQKNASDVWEEVVLVPSINQFVGFDGSKNLVSKPVGSATPTAHASTHAPNGSDALPWSGSIHGYGLNAARPAAGAANAGYVYFSTDVSGGTLYRSNGATWDQIATGLTAAPQAHAASHLSGGTDALSWSVIHGRGLLSARPAASASNSSFYYFATDINYGTLYQSNGSSWVTASRDIPGLNQGSAGAGNYVMTASYAEINMGGSLLMELTVPQDGTFFFTASVNLIFSGATFAALQGATFKLRRTNNTPADIAESERSCLIPIMTTTTLDGASVALVNVEYSGTAGDIIGIFAKLTALPSVGTVEVNNSSISLLGVY